MISIFSICSSQNCTIIKYNGQIILKGDTVSGKKEGIWIETDSLGVIQNKSTYTNDKKHGLSISYINGKKYSKTNWCNNWPCDNDTLFTFYPDGSSLFVLFRDTIQGSGGFMLKHWNEKGKLKVIDGNGNFKGIPVNNSYWEGEYINGKRDGCWKFWNINRQLISIHNYSNGVQHGYFSWFKSNLENIKTTGALIRNDGYYEFGKLITTHFYEYNEEGILQKESIYDGGGNLIETKTY